MPDESTKTDKTLCCGSTERREPIPPVATEQGDDGSVAASRREEREAVEDEPWMLRAGSVSIPLPFVLIRNYLCEGDLTFGVFDYESGYYQLSDGDGREPEDVVACGDAVFLSWRQVEEAMDKYTRKKKGRAAP